MWCMSWMSPSPAELCLPLGVRTDVRLFCSELVSTGHQWSEDKLAFPARTETTGTDFWAWKYVLFCFLKGGSCSLFYPQHLAISSNHVHACRLSCFSHIQLFVTICTVARQSPQSMGFSKQEYCSGLPCPPPGESSYLGIKPTSRTSPALGEGWSLNVCECSDWCISLVLPWTGVTPVLCCESDWKHEILHPASLTSLTVKRWAGSPVTTSCQLRKGGEDCGVEFSLKWELWRLLQGCRWRLWVRSAYICVNYPSGGRR